MRSACDGGGDLVREFVRVRVSFSAARIVGFREGRALGWRRGLGCCSRPVGLDEVCVIVIVFFFSIFFGLCYCFLFYFSRFFSILSILCVCVFCAGKDFLFG